MAERRRDVKRKLREVNLLLWAAWDPIGLGVPTDEYDSYAPQVLGLLESGAPIEALTAKLSVLRTEQVGLSADPDADRNAAQKLIDWYSEQKGEDAL
jgi:hypothetical protein